jgi:hypothetical protein
MRESAVAPYCRIIWSLNIAFLELEHTRDKEGGSDAEDEE